MDRDCNNCVYSTRDGGCRKFNCDGTKTVECVENEAKVELLDEVLREIDAKFYEEGYGYSVPEIRSVCEVILSFKENLEWKQ